MAVEQLVGNKFVERDKVKLCKGTTLEASQLVQHFYFIFQLHINYNAIKKFKS